MQIEEWNLETKAQDDDQAKSESPEELADCFGIRLSLLILCVAFFIAAIWLISTPSFPRSVARWVTSPRAMPVTANSEMNS